MMVLSSRGNFYLVSLALLQPDVELILHLVVTGLLGCAPLLFHATSPSF